MFISLLLSFMNVSYVFQFRSFWCKLESCNQIRETWISSDWFWWFSYLTRMYCCGFFEIECAASAGLVRVKLRIGLLLQSAKLLIWLQQSYRRYEQALVFSVTCRTVLLEDQDQIVFVWNLINQLSQTWADSC